VAKVELSKQHTIGKDAARQRAEQIANRLKDKLGGIEWAWSGDTINFEAKSGTAKGAKGRVEVTDTKITVVVELTFLQSAFKGMVEQRIKQELDSVS
jgi:putative polyhydroxyalkanoate system protein